MGQNGKYLVVNAGSSSLKFSLYKMPEELELINGYMEKIGLEDCFWTLKINGEKITNSKFLKTHDEAVIVMVEELINNKIISTVEEIKGVGHRVLHGGEYYSNSVIIDDVVLEKIIELTNLGPLHHPGEIAGIKAMKNFLPGVSQVAVFDTAFHQTIPEENFIYPVPYEWYKNFKVRKYGFHGTSHKYITEVMKERLNKENVNLIVCHLGSGSSITSIKDGKSFNTTMGLTPLDGLMMGTRAGTIDASIIDFILKNTDKSIDDVMNDLNKRSGLLGLTGKSDFRDVSTLASAGNEKAILAINMLVNSIVKFIVQYYVELDCNIDAIILTAGMGENASNLRELVINKISKLMGIKLNKEANNVIAGFKDIHEGVITTDDSNVPVIVIPTNEEVMILRDAYKLSV